MKKYGCIGKKLTHSFSKEIHAKLADYKYELMELTPDEIPGFFEEKNFGAVNVTMPYKQTVIPYLDSISTVAERIGAVNTIVNKNGKLFGYNTDYYGMKALIEKVGLDFNGKKVLILGSGGTSKTACVVATDLGASQIWTVSRNKTENCITYEEAIADHGDAKIIINTTPAGMYPDCQSKPIDIDSFEDLEGVIDAVYNPLCTNLVLDAKKRGIKAEGGLYMLVMQAVVAVEKFLDTSIQPQVANQVYASVLASKENIVLTGMPGSGKSTVGKLFNIEGFEFVDTDLEIEKRCGCFIKELISTKGETYFRDLETQVIREVSSQGGRIISTGGGAILREENVRCLKQNGKLFFLNADIKRLQATQDRPLSDTNEKLMKLYDERKPVYESTADVIVPDMATPREEADYILRKRKELIEGMNCMKILVINGPNLNMLGVREPAHYGRETYADLVGKIQNYCDSKGVEVKLYQSNHEGDLVDAIQGAYQEMDGIVINPGAYTHTSIAILDAVKSVNIPTVEVHISKVEEREEFRQISYVRLACVKTITGHGTQGYLEAIDYLIERKQNDCNI